MTRTDQRRAARARMKDAQHRQDSAGYLAAVRELAALDDKPTAADERDKAEWIEAVRARKLEIYEDKYRADAERDARAYYDQAEELHARRDADLSEIDRTMLIDLCVRLDARNTHEALAGKHDAYVRKFAAAALSRAEAFCISGAMNKAQTEAIAELTQERLDADRSHAAVRLHTDAIRMQVMQGRNRDDEWSAIQTMHQNFRKPRPN